MMRIAYVCADPGVPVFGAKGCSVHVQEGLRALIGQGAHVTLFAVRSGGRPPADLKQVPVHLLPQASGRDSGLREQVALAANRSLATLLEREGPFDMAYERYALWSYAGMAYAQAKGIPGMLEVNAPLIEEQAQHRGLVDRNSAVRVARQAFGAATALLAVSDEVAAYLATYPEAQGRIHVVPNGVDTARFQPGLAASCPVPAGSFTVGFVGSLKPWHGLSYLAEAFALLYRQTPTARLLIVGDGPERVPLEHDLSAREVLGAAHFTGAVTPGEVPALLASMDVAVAPYPKLDTCYFSPLKVFEYMAAGVPVVASRVGQLVTLVRDGENGLLCPPGDAGALAAALGRLQHDPALRARLAKAARSRVLQMHTWAVVARRVFDLAGLASTTQPCCVEGAA